MSKTINATIADEAYASMRTMLAADFSAASAKADEVEASIDEAQAKLTERTSKRDTMRARAEEKRASFVALFGVEPTIG